MKLARGGRKWSGQNPPFVPHPWGTSFSRCGECGLNVAWRDPAAPEPSINRQFRPPVNCGGTRNAVLASCDETVPGSRHLLTFYTKRLIAAVAIPRKSRKPKTSVKVVTTTADATAGSTPILRRNRGTPAPARPAMTMFPAMATPRTRPSPGLRVHSMPTTPTRIPSKRPWSSPSRTSRASSLEAPIPTNSPRAMERTIIVRV